MAVEVDEALDKHIGTFGKYQVLLVILLNFTYVFDAFHIMAPVFTALEPEHWCNTSVVQYVNCSHEQQMSFAIPKEKKEGDMVYKSCESFMCNYSVISEDEVCGPDVKQ